MVENSDGASRLEKMSLKNSTVNGVVEVEDVVTPWNVESRNDEGIDYDKLISKSLYLV